MAHESTETLCIQQYKVSRIHVARRRISLVTVKIISVLYWPSSNKDCENTPWLNHSNETFMAPPHVESFKVIQQQLRDATASVIHKTHVSRVEMASRAIFVTNEIYNIVCQPAQRVHVSQLKTTNKMQAFRNGQAKRGICKYVCEHQSSSM